MVYVTSSRGKLTVRFAAPLPKPGDRRKVLAVNTNLPDTRSLPGTG